jgi:hypothetical protein
MTCLVRMLPGSVAKEGEADGVPCFYCERWTGLSIWAHALRRMIAFQGGYFNTTDPAEAAFIRATHYFQRGQIIELPEGPLAQRSPTPPPNPPCGRSMCQNRFLPSRARNTPPSEPPPGSWPNTPASRLQSRPDPDALADRRYPFAAYRPGPELRTPPPSEPTLPLTSPFHPARATHLPPRLRIACALLTHLLANGDVPSPAVWAHARRAGVSRQALNRARDYLHISPPCCVATPRRMKILARAGRRFLRRGPEVEVPLVLGARISV